MASRQIVKLGDDILREQAKTVTEFNEKLSILIDDMIETMFKENGVGLAAPQVGILRRVCVISIDEGKTIYELVNPTIVKHSGKQINSEGCLSVPNRHGEVLRPKKIVVESQNRYGASQTHKVDGFLAVAFCHEIDHLCGVLFIDKIIDND